VTKYSITVNKIKRILSIFEFNIRPPNINLV